MKKKKIYKPKTKTIGTRIPIKHIQTLERLAASEGRNISNYIYTHILKHLLEKEKTDTKEVRQHA